MGKKISEVDIALSIMAKAHRGQYDLDRRPAVLHPLRVGLSFGTDCDKMVVGYLHDVIEDSDYTLEDLKELGISDKNIRSVQLLTHDAKEPYAAYIGRIRESGDEVAISVKEADLRDNIQRGTAGGHIRLVEKHTNGLKLLKGQ